jgi:hypothetical protein
MDVIKAELHGLVTAFKAQEWDKVVDSKSLPIVLALSTHAYLAQGEPDYKAYLYITGWFFTFVSLSSLLFASGNVSTLSQAFSQTWGAFQIYFGTLLTSIVIYRAWFHRLRGYPGPFIARITNFYNVGITIPKIRYFIEAEKIHKKYGDYVRLGPRELSISDVNAVQAIHGVTTKCTKGIWYGAGEHIEGFSLQTTRSKQDHKERRKVWEKAFNSKTLRDYEPRINRHSAKLMQQLEERVGKSLKINEWMNFYSFDVMGDIGFSKSFDMLDKGEEDHIIKTLHASMIALGLLRNVTWVTSLMLRLPVVQKDIQNFINWSSDVLKERKKVRTFVTSLFTCQIHTLTPVSENAARE